jgi:hypothetical protein
MNCEPHIWGEGLEEEAVNQMLHACRLPISLAGALMPDAHVGYGLPIGGVLATANAVIPYGVGGGYRLPDEAERAGLEPELDRGDARSARKHHTI